MEEAGNDLAPCTFTVNIIFLVLEQTIFIALLLICATDRYIRHTGVHADNYTAVGTALFMDTRT